MKGPRQFHASVAAKIKSMNCEGYMMLEENSYALGMNFFMVSVP